MSENLIFGAVKVPVIKTPMETIDTGIIFMGQRVLLEKPSKECDAIRIRTEFMLEMEGLLLGIKLRKTK